jgi:M6 family metalloprotease-like protein
MATWQMRSGHLAYVQGSLRLYHRSMILKRIVTLSTALMLALLAGGMILSSPDGASVAEAQTAPTEELSGVLNVRWIDPPEHSDHEHEVELVLADGRGRKTDLELGGDALRRAGGAVALNGKPVTVEGEGTPGEEFDAQSIEPTQSVREVSQRTVSGQKPTVTVLCRFADSTGVTPHPKAWFETLMGSTNPGLDHYWREVSYNNINLSGSTVVGWYNLPLSKSRYQTNGGYDEDLLARDCTQAANADVFFPDYSNVNLMFNGDPGNYALGGTNTMSLDGQTRNYGMTWMPRFAYERGYGTGQVWLAHEMGHSFGLPHSSGPYNQTYDSDWDPMSDGSVCSPAHNAYGCVGVYTNSYHMDELLGWIPPARKYTATSASDQNITLERLGAPDPNGAYLMAQIPIAGSTSRFYVVEARHLTGYDGQIPGEAIVIHKVDTTLSDRNAKVVDATNNGDPNDAGAMWLPGETFTDSANGIKVKVTGATASGYDVTVNPSSSGEDDATAPRLTSSVPAPGGTMARSASITVESSEPLDPTTLETPDGQYSNVELFKFNKEKKRWQYVWDTRVSCDRACDTITLDPYPGDASKRLSAGKYRVKAWRDSSGLKDLSGTPLSGGGDYLVSRSGDYVYWWFRAGS